MGRRSVLPLVQWAQFHTSLFITLFTSVFIPLTRSFGLTVIPTPGLLHPTVAHPKPQDENWSLSLYAEIEALPEQHKPRMEAAEVLLWMETTTNAKRYFEYGMGGSTFVAVTKLHVPHVTAVDSDLAWIQQIEGLLCQHKIDARQSQTDFRHVDIGITEKWGYPVTNTSQERWPAYAGAIANLAVPPDVVFVDGRFRVACVFAALLHCPSSTLVMLHDVVPARAHYDAILPYVDIVDRAESLTVFRRKATAVLDELISEWAMHNLDPRM